jgi:hypothetical protein
VNLVIELNCSSSTTATTAPTVTTDEPLARTGADVGTTLEVAILLIVAGTWLVVGGRGLSIRTTRRIGRHG